MRRLPRTVHSGVIVLSTLTAVAIAAPASAATTGVATVLNRGTQVRFTAGSKATNKVVVTRSGRTVTIDDRVRLKAGKGCTAVKGDSTRVRCALTSPYTGDWRLLIDLGDRADSLTIKTNISVTAYGGSGNDTIKGGSGFEILRGGTGNDKIWGNGGGDRLYGDSGADALDGGTSADQLYGGSGADKLYGGTNFDSLYGDSGNDLLHGGPDYDALDGGTGADTMHGDGSIDTVTYRTRTTPVVADLDGARNDDGAPGERDTIAGDVERLEGGSAGDTLTGNDGANRLAGGRGGDRLLGAGGADELLGEGGVDTLDGGAGDDLLTPDGRQSFGQGPSGEVLIITDPVTADVLRGGSGTDTADYSSRYQLPVSVDLDGESGDDGQAGEGDTVGTDVENVRGTIMADRLTGNAAGNNLDGSDGDDVLTGLGGSDGLFGGAGRDQLDGREPNGDDRDRIDGGIHEDECLASPSDVVTNCER